MALLPRVTRFLTRLNHGRGPHFPKLARFLVALQVMDRIALTIWNDIVSPVFDAAEHVLFWSKENGDRETINVSALTPPEKARFIESRQAYALICGAISEQAHGMLLDRGIQVIPWIRGNVDEVIAAFTEGKLDTREFTLPGCWGCRNRAGRGRGRGRRRGSGGEPQQTIEEASMPKRDGTGPMGQGPATGRGMGPCAAGRPRGRGRGREQSQRRGVRGGTRRDG